MRLAQFLHFSSALVFGSFIFFLSYFEYFRVLPSVSFSNRDYFMVCCINNLYIKSSHKSYHLLKQKEGKNNATHESIQRHHLCSIG